MDSLLPNEVITAPREVRTDSTNLLHNCAAIKPLTERLVEFLGAHKEPSFGVCDIAKGIELPDDKIDSLRSPIVLLVKEERSDRSGPGLYRVKEEQAHDAA
jgi:hypothetical protein